MAFIHFDGIDNYASQIRKLSNNATEIIGRAVYEGANIVADEIKSGINGLPSKTGVTKQGLESGFGISRMQDDNGYLNVKTGFEGYNANGVANVLMARIFESGTSKVPKRPFVRPAVTRAKPKAEKRMEEVLDEEIKKLMD